MSKIFPFSVTLAATAFAIPIAQKATAVPISNLDYVELATLEGLGEKAVWKKQEVLSLPVGVIKESNIPSKKVSQKIYRVQSGDTLSAIAERKAISLDDLIRINNLPNPDRLNVGQQLVIPLSKAIANNNEKPMAPNTHPISPIATKKISVVAMATLGTLRSRDYPTVDRQTTNRWLQKSGYEQAILRRRRSANANNKFEESAPINNQPKSTVPDSRSLSPRSSLIGTASFNRRDENLIRKRIGETVAPELPPLSSPDNYLPNIPRTFTGYIYPAKGVLTSGYGYRWGKMHKGIDIAAPIGTPVVAAAAGKVVWAGWNKGGYGNMVKIQHSNGSLTLYAHNSRVLVFPGQMVRQGEQIAQIGSTGYSTGPHLHFEIYRGTEVVNPMAYLPR